MASGGTQTPMLMALVGNDPLRKVVESAHPIRRIGKAYEVVELAAFLLSDAAGFITGAAIAVDGGVYGGLSGAIDWHRNSRVWQTI